MRYLAEAIANMLATIFTADRVFHGTAEDIKLADGEYVTYLLPATGDITPSTIDRAQDAIINQTIQITFYGLNDATLLHLVWVIYNAVVRMETMRCGDLMRINLVSQAVTEDPDKTEDGQVVWQGLMIFEAMYAPADEGLLSSSSSSSSSASSSSGSSASSSSSS